MELPHSQSQCLWQFEPIICFSKIHLFLQAILTQQHETPVSSTKYVLGRYMLNKQFMLLTLPVPIATDVD